MKPPTRRPRTGAQPRPGRPLERGAAITITRGRYRGQAGVITESKIVTNASGPHYLYRIALADGSRATPWLYRHSIRPAGRRED
jgi:hypothetical protein